MSEQAQINSPYRCHNSKGKFLEIRELRSGDTKSIPRFQNERQQMAPRLQLDKCIFGLKFNGEEIQRKKYFYIY